MASSALHLAVSKHLREITLDVDLSFEPGVTVVAGPSGAGKSTLLRLVAGLISPDAGTIRLGGRILHDADHGLSIPSYQRDISLVFQDYALFPHLSVRENVAYGLVARHVRRAERQQRVAAMLERLGIASLAHARPPLLSGGQRQRVALARALAIDPQLLLLDEPFSALDPSLRASVREEVRGILSETGITTLLVTHDQEEALSVADQVAVLRDGVVAQFGTPQRLYTDPVDLEMARFLGDANLVDGTIEGQLVLTPLGALAVRPPRNAAALVGGPAVVLVRPEQIAISAAGAAGAPGRVLHSEFHGHDSVVEVASETPQLPGIIRVRVQGASNLEPDARVTLSARGEAQAWPRPTGSGVRPGLRHSGPVAGQP